MFAIFFVSRHCRCVQVDYSIAMPRKQLIYDKLEVAWGSHIDDRSVKETEKESSSHVWISLGYLDGSQSIIDQSTGPTQTTVAHNLLVLKPTVTALNPSKPTMTALNGLAHALKFTSLNTHARSPNGAALNASPPTLTSKAISTHTPTPRNPTSASVGASSTTPTRMIVVVLDTPSHIQMYSIFLAFLKVWMSKRSCGRVER